MDPNKFNTWDITLKVIALLGVSISGIWAITSYRMSTEKEFRRPLWDQQLTLYFQATEAASKVATLPHGKERDTSMEKFWNLYFGPLVVVEDDELVCQAMVDFGDCIPKPGASFSKDTCDKQEIQNRALVLANRARDSIGKQWDRKLDELKKPIEKRTCRLGRQP